MVPITQRHGTISHAEILILQLDSRNWYAQNHVKFRSRSAHGHIMVCSLSGHGQITVISRSGHGQVTVRSRLGHDQVTVTSRDAHVNRKQTRSLHSLGMAYGTEGHQCCGPSTTMCYSCIVRPLFRVLSTVSWPSYSIYSAPTLYIHKINLIQSSGWWQYIYWYTTFVFHTLFTRMKRDGLTETERTKLIACAAPPIVYYSLQTQLHYPTHIIITGRSELTFSPLLF
jgi:hypothetical protein